MRILKFILYFGIFFSFSIFFSGCVTPGSYIKVEDEVIEDVTPWPGGSYTPKLLTDMTPGIAIKDLEVIFERMQGVDDHIGFRLTGELDINSPSNQSNISGYLKFVQAYMIVRDPGGEFKYMLSRSNTTVQEDHIYINPGYKLIFIDLVEKPISVKKIDVNDIRCSWPDINWNLVDDSIAGKYGIQARPMYRRPYMIRCGDLITIFFKRQADAEKAADAPFNIQKGLEKTLSDRRAKVESLAPQYRELAIKPPVSEEQRKNIVLAELMTRQQDYTKAISHYIDVINLDPVSYPEAYFNLALLSEQMQRYSMAVYYMKLYLMLVPEGEDSRRAQDKMYEWEYMSKDKSR